MRSHYKVNKILIKLNIISTIAIAYPKNYSYDSLDRLDQLTDRISALQWCTSKIQFLTVYPTKLAFRVFLQNYNNQSFIFEAKKNFYFKT